MRLTIVLSVACGVLFMSGCQQKTAQPVAHNEEPFTPSYAALDTLDAVPAAAVPAEPTPAPAPADEAAETADEPLAPIGGEVYVVQKGDTLYKLARRFYDDQSRWRDIWEANKTRVPDPDKLQVGMKLIIP